MRTSYNYYHCLKNVLYKSCVALLPTILLFSPLLENVFGLSGYETKTVSHGGKKPPHNAGQPKPKALKKTWKTSIRIRV